MDQFQRIKALNPNVSLFSVQDEVFCPYGKVLNSYNFSELMDIMEKIATPDDGTSYVASIAEMELTEVKKHVQSNFYGGIEIQIGYCIGMNSNLNGLEYHKGSEVIIAVTNLVLLLGKVQEIKDNTYSTDCVEGFYLSQGTAVELYQTTLHFAPCKVNDNGYKSIIILPKGTNVPIEEPVVKLTEEDLLLFMKNKWLLAHPENKLLLAEGAYPGIIGENIRIQN